MRWLIPGLVALALATTLATTGCRHDAGTKNDPQAEFVHGWEKFREGEYDVAATSFRAAANTPEGNPLRLAALYGEATVWNLRRPGADASRARGIYQQIIDTAPQSDLAACSSLDLANMLYPPPDVEPDWDALVRSYQKVADRFPLNPAGEEAFIAQQFVLLRRFDPPTTREAVTRLEKFAAERPDSPFNYCALILAAAGYETLGQWRDLVNIRERAAEVSDHVAQRMAGNTSGGLMMNSINWMTNCWAIASVAEFQLGDFATARKYYDRIVEKAPADPLYGAALVALKRMDDKDAEVRRAVSAAY